MKTLLGPVLVSQSPAAGGGPMGAGCLPVWVILISKSAFKKNLGLEPPFKLVVLLYAGGAPVNTASLAPLGG